ncbi:OmpA family protein [Prevotella aff. ruminicola Tc2-24]|uniref:OmpA family protein n=1 Tax=Prevotella aff. ruminicola Tc2-24 TaxID=81582 RepID=A0A1I0NDP3_9BACT|nr:OmpA family protein [Prevotella aff. ruminicola Tc2-24]SEV99532.1 OmpA family protein [Prevotella aff. ruminicola Tc2-24]
MAKHNVWMSVSDLMTGLMVIFLFVAIAYMIQVNENQTVLTDYVDTKNHLHDKLVKEFEGDTAKWQMQVGKDLSMKFNNPQVLFATGSYQLTPAFCDILNEFIPRYLNILLNDSLSSRIQEIRIEGHTDNVPAPQFDQDPFMANIKLSQLRSYSVLEYIKNMPFYQQYTDDQRAKLEFWFTSNGLSYGKAVDSNGEYTALSGNPIDKEKSRRVEFRIVTTGEEILENFVKKNNSLIP